MVRISLSAVLAGSCLSARLCSRFPRRNISPVKRSLAGCHGLQSDLRIHGDGHLWSRDSWGQKSTWTSVFGPEVTRVSVDKVDNAGVPMQARTVVTEGSYQQASLRLWTTPSVCTGPAGRVTLGQFQKSQQEKIVLASSLSSCFLEAKWIPWTEYPAYEDDLEKWYLLSWSKQMYKLGVVILIRGRGIDNWKDR